MELIEKLSPDFVFTDARGSLVQLAHTGYQQINAVFTKKGEIRGNFHYHKQTEEIFYVFSGHVKLTAAYDDRKETYEFKTGDMFRIPVNVRHNCEYLEDTFLVVLYSSPVDLPDGSRDIIPDPYMQL